LTEEQTYWCNEQLESWTVNSEGKVDVNGHANILDKKIKRFPVSFGTVSGDFFCSRCASLESLEGAPTLVKGDFFCNICTSLKTLEGAPTLVKGKFFCYGCFSLPAVQHDIIKQYNDKKLTWEEAYKILHTPVLLQAKDLGII